jgi:hypothetical protein
VLHSGADTPCIILICTIITREHWTIYREPGFLAVVWFGFSPTPFPLLSSQQDVSLSQSPCVLPVELSYGSGAKSYDREKAWPSINHSILSDYNYRIVYSHSSLDLAELIFTSLPQRVLKWFQHKESSVSVHESPNIIIIKGVSDSPFLTIVARSNSD